MAENILINGETYNGVESVELNTTDGKKVLYFQGQPVTVVQETGSDEAAVMSQAAVTNALGKLSNEKVDQSDVVQEAGSSTTKVMSQKAVTDALANVTQQKPEFAESLEWLDENGDHSKLYVLPDGYIYAWMTDTVTIPPPELIVHGSNKNYQINKRINSSGAEVAQNGVFLTNLISVDMTNPLDLFIKGLKNNAFAFVYGVYFRVDYYKDGTRLNSKVWTPSDMTSENGGWKVDIYDANYQTANGVRLWISCNANAALTEDDTDGYYKNISVTIPALGGTTETTAWMSTGLPFVSSDYGDRIISLERQTEGLNGWLNGKKIVYDGDSIFAYSRSQTPIAEISGSTYENQAVSSAWLSATTEKHSVVNNLANLPTDGDLYCFEGGINDYWNDVPIGSVSSSYTGTLDTSTICGALETIFRYAQSNFVGKPICFVIVHKISNTATAQNNNGDTFTDYHDAMIQVCEKYSIPYYDAFMYSGLNVNIEAHKTAFCPDLVHPNDEGHKRYYVPQMLNLFREIMPNV